MVRPDTNEQNLRSHPLVESTESSASLLCSQSVLNTVLALSASNDAWLEPVRHAAGGTIWLGPLARALCVHLLHYCDQYMLVPSLKYILYLVKMYIGENESIG